MSLERRLRRQQQKNGGNGSSLAQLQGLQKVVGDLGKLGGLGEAAHGVEQLVGELKGLRDQLQGAARQLADYGVELDRQRAVFLRFLLSPDIFVGPGDYLQKFLAAEQRYRAEYDAMRALVLLLTWAKEAP